MKFSPSSNGAGKSVVAKAKTASSSHHNRHGAAGAGVSNHNSSSRNDNLRTKMGSYRDCPFDLSGLNSLRALASANVVKKGAEAAVGQQGHGATALDALSGPAGGRHAVEERPWQRAGVGAEKLTAKDKSQQSEAMRVVEMRVQEEIERRTNTKTGQNKKKRLRGEDGEEEADTAEAEGESIQEEEEEKEEDDMNKNENEEVVQYHGKKKHKKGAAVSSSSTKEEGEDMEVRREIGSGQLRSQYTNTVTNELYKKMHMGQRKHMPSSSASLQPKQQEQNVDNDINGNKKNTGKHSSHSRQQAVAPRNRMQEIERRQKEALFGGPSGKRRR